MSKKMYMPVNVMKEYDNGRSSVYWGNNNYLCVNSKDLLTADGIADSSKKADGHGAGEFVERYQSALCSFSSLCNEHTREKVWGCNELSEAIRKRPSEFVEKMGIICGDISKGGRGMEREVQRHPCPRPFGRPE